MGWEEGEGVGCGVAAVHQQWKIARQQGMQHWLLSYEEIEDLGQVTDGKQTRRQQKKETNLTSVHRQNDMQYD